MAQALIERAVVEDIMGVSNGGGIWRRMYVRGEKILFTLLYAQADCMPTRHCHMSGLQRHVAGTTPLTFSSHLLHTNSRGMPFRVRNSSAICNPEP